MVLLRLPGELRDPDPPGNPHIPFTYFSKQKRATTLNANKRNTTTVLQ